MNTGSVGRPKDGDPRAGYCLLEISEDAITAEQVRLPYNVGLASAQLIDAGLPEYFAEYLRTGGEVPEEWVATHVDLEQLTQAGARHSAS